MTDSMQYTTYFKHVKAEATKNTLKDSSQVGSSSKGADSLVCDNDIKLPIPDISLPV